MKVIVLIALLFIFFHVFLLFSPIFPDITMSVPFQHIAMQYGKYGLYPLAYFDGAHYILIAREGYGQYQQAYFPLFPLLMHLIAPVMFANYFFAGFVISCVSFIAGLSFFKQYLGMVASKKNDALWALVFLLVFPTSFFFITVYPESLFFFLASACFYFLQKKQFAFAALFGFLAGICKIQGALLIIPFFLSVLAVQKISVKELQYSLKRLKIRQILFSLSPVLGLLSYSLYLLFRYKDPLYYLHVQEEFGANRSGDSLILLPQVLYRYIKIFTTADWNFQYMISVLEFSVFTVIFVTLLFELYRIYRKQLSVQPTLLGMHVFSLAALLLPTLTGTFSSLPRYALLSYSFFVIFGSLRHRLVKLIILFIFFSLHILLFISFTHGFFIS